MSVTTADIHKIAHLARLRIDEAEIPNYTQHLNNLLKLVSEMNQVNTNGIEPMSHSMEGLQQRARKDIITEENQRELFQSIAPQTAEGVYIVPKVIE